VRGQPGDANFDIKSVPDQVTNCPGGYTVVKNAQSTSSTESEFVNFIPELNANLVSLRSQGYDAISVQLRMGSCVWAVSAGQTRKTAPRWQMVGRRRIAMRVGMVTFS